MYLAAIYVAVVWIFFYLEIFELFKFEQDAKEWTSGRSAVECCSSSLQQWYFCDGACGVNELQMAKFRVWDKVYGGSALIYSRSLCGWG